MGFFAAQAGKLSIKKIVPLLYEIKLKKVCYESEVSEILLVIQTDVANLKVLVFWVQCDAGR